MILIFTKFITTLLLTTMLFASNLLHVKDLNPNEASKHWKIKYKILPYDSLNPSLPPSKNFNLSNWYLSIPSDRDRNGFADNVYEKELNSGYQNSYFYTGQDGGMVFRCPIKGPKTSNNTNYVRVELREMLRRGNTTIRTTGVTKNNWVFSSAPSKDIKAAGAVDGEMTATLKVNHVTTTGQDYQVGRIVIGQIHANDNEPIRLYYRKLKKNKLGSIYFAHEPKEGNDIYYEMIGSKSDNAPNPSDGIALNEKFNYKIKVVGNKMWVSISRQGKKDIVQSVNMNKSGYGKGGQYMYFKAGLYNQNNSGDRSDYAQVTFYNLKQSH